MEMPNGYDRKKSNYNQEIGVKESPNNLRRLFGASNYQALICSKKFDVEKDWERDMKEGK